MSRPIGRTIVTYGLAAIGALIGAILLWLSTGFVADFLLGLSGMSPREGGRAMVAFFAIGPFGALLGFGLGVWLVLHQRSAHRSIAAFAGAIVTAIALVAAIYGAVIGLYALTDDVLVRNGPRHNCCSSFACPPAPRCRISLKASASTSTPTRTRCSPP